MLRLLEETAKTAEGAIAVISAPKRDQLDAFVYDQLDLFGGRHDLLECGGGRQRSWGSCWHNRG